MSKNITISSFKNIPKGLLVAAVLFLLTEGLIYSNRAELVKNYWNKFLINEHILLESPGDYDYLIMGDSIQKTGILPLELGEKVLNLGLPGGKPMSLYLMLKRYLKNHRPPKAIFLYVDPEEPRDSLYVILRYFVSVPEFISTWKDLTPHEREVFLMRYLPTLDLRKVGLTEGDEYIGSNSAFTNQMKRDRGYMPAARSGLSLSEDYFRKDRTRYQSRVSMTKKDMEYLDKFMKLASSENIKVVFLGFLVPKELYNILEITSFNKKYRNFYANLGSMYPHAYLVKDPIYYMDNKYFGDMSHLNQAGSEIYSKYFNDEILKRFL